MQQTPFRRAFSAADAVLAEYGEEDLLARILADSPSEYAPEVIAQLLAIISWTTTDEGASMFRQAEAWLVEASDLRQVQVALNLEVYPFRDRDQMNTVLKHVANVFPEVAELCSEFIVSRRE